ncbi:NifU family protein [Paludisphaera mucosa]|uniref:NifU family protein n=1 Tax=Paludisphaera mucosa TaxID=3030827 RepID=A0ABT6FCY7_9BACT|nr:NifU family protein [Paludisphaera mucosa]MDG3005445.1 NifU family protein [Paludisphaera mucosa]
MTMPDRREFEASMARIEVLTGVLERCPDLAARSASRELVGALLELHGAGLARILELIAGSGDAGDELVSTLARDGLVASVLLLHDLHPIDLKSRVGIALDGVRARLGPHADLDLVGIEGGTLRLRLAGGGCGGCPSTSAAMKKSVEDAILEAAPDLASIEFVEPLEPPQGAFSLPVITL